VRVRSFQLGFLGRTKAIKKINCWQNPKLLSIELQPLISLSTFSNKTILFSFGTSKSARHIASTNQNKQTNKTLEPQLTSPKMSDILNSVTGSADKSSKDTQSGITGAGKTATSTLGNTVGGLTNTVGGVVGAAGRGLGETVNSVTGDMGRPVGDGLSNIGSGLEGAGDSASKGVKNAGEWKKPSSG